MMQPVDARRRWFGAFYVVVAGGMLIWGQTVLDAHLRGRGFLVYWLVCFLFTALAMVTALMDIRSMKKHIREERNELLQKTLSQFGGSNHEQTDRKPPSPST